MNNKYTILWLARVGVPRRLQTAAKHSNKEWLLALLISEFLFVYK